MIWLAFAAPCNIPAVAEPTNFPSPSCVICSLKREEEEEEEEELYASLLCCFDLVRQLLLFGCPRPRVPSTYLI
jgi:hypothetical protein